MERPMKRRLAVFALIAALTAAGAYTLYQLRHQGLPEGIVAGNGRLEATEVDVATKLAGRILELGPHEGDWVEAGTPVAQIDAEALRAQLQAAQAQVAQARKSRDESAAGVRKSAADLKLADKTLRRSQALVERGFVSPSRLDSDQTGMEGAMAGMAQARSRVAEADAATQAAQAQAATVQATLDDTVIKSPISGRVLYRLAEPGEVLASGGKMLTLVDLDDMYMTVYLPTAQAGQVALGSPARIVLDALPAQVIPAKVVFVASKAQFTPREVETRTEREKLMFRLKVKADPNWLHAHRDLAKGGMPGQAYIKLAVDAPWPAGWQGKE